MSYFPCDIPFMDEEELKANGLSSLKETVDPEPDTIDPDTISRKAVIEAFYRLDIMLKPSVIYEIVHMLQTVPPKEVR